MSSPIIEEDQNPEQMQDQETSTAITSGDSGLEKMDESEEAVAGDSVNSVSGADGTAIQSQLQMMDIVDAVVAQPEPQTTTVEYLTSDQYQVDEASIIWAAGKKRELIYNHLVLLIHAKECKRQVTMLEAEPWQCAVYSCDEMKPILDHMTTCQDGKDCTVPLCSSSKQIMDHWEHCKINTCVICMPMKLRDAPIGDGCNVGMTIWSLLSPRDVPIISSLQIQYSDTPKVLVQASDVAATQNVSKGNTSGMDWPAIMDLTHKYYLIQHTMVHLFHAEKCQKEAGNCGFYSCETTKILLNHIDTCQVRENCPELHCSSLRQVRDHWKQCSSSSCSICIFLKRTRGSPSSFIGAVLGFSADDVHVINTIQIQCPIIDRPDKNIWMDLLQLEGARMFIRTSSKYNASGNVAFYVPKIRVPFNAENNLGLAEKRQLIQQCLVLLLHAEKCHVYAPQSNGDGWDCAFYSCEIMKNLLKHWSACQAGKFCIERLCTPLKQIMEHYKDCNRTDCSICLPFKRPHYGVKFNPNALHIIKTPLSENDISVIKSFDLSGYVSLKSILLMDNPNEEELFQNYGKLIRHLIKCEKSRSKAKVQKYHKNMICTNQDCETLRTIFGHMMICEDDNNCTLRHCLTLKKIFGHILQCNNRRNCPECLRFVGKNASTPSDQNNLSCALEATGIQFSAGARRLPSKLLEFYMNSQRFKSLLLE